MAEKSTFCKLLYHRKCKQRGVGGQKKPNLVNVVCERPLMINNYNLLYREPIVPLDLTEHLFCKRGSMKNKNYRLFAVRTTQNFFN